MATSKMWFVSIDGQENGPCTSGELIELVRDGKLRLSDKVRRSDSKDWLLVGQSKKLLSAAKQEKPPTPLTAAPPRLPDNSGSVPAVPRGINVWLPALLNRPNKLRWVSLISLVVLLLGVAGTIFLLAQTRAANRNPNHGKLAGPSTEPVNIQASKELTNSIGMKLVSIPKGTFQMGSPPSELGSGDDERQLEVTLTQDYYLAAFEVTQAQYRKVMGNNPSNFQGDVVAERHPQTGRVVEEVDSSSHPVERVSWEDAVEFCKRLSDLPEEKQAGRVYRLPTEAEWECACRAGIKTAFSFGEASGSLGDFAWFYDNSKGKTHPVGEKKPNSWGLYDMHGNVWEWCSDWYGDYPKGAVNDPTGASEGSNRVLRGGSWDSEAARCRSAFRFRYYPSDRGDYFGFRVALSSGEIPK